MDKLKKTRIRALQTSWCGIKFRSRLEARWAVCFDYLKIRYHYEPQPFELPDGTRYLPDFFLPDIQFWAEVKPQDPTKGELAKCAALVLGSQHSCLLLDGPPAFKTYRCLFWDCGDITDSSALVDIDYHLRRYYQHEHRLFSSPGDAFSCRYDFSECYQKAVDAALNERFGVYPDLGDEPFNASRSDLGEAWRNS